MNRHNNMGLIVLAVIVVGFLVAAVLRAPHKPAPEPDPVPAAQAPQTSTAPQ